MKLFLKNLIGVIGACAALCGIALMLYALSSYVSSIVTSNPQSVNKDESKKITVVLDAGHGGIDGGAVGVSGSLEKDLNLSIVKKTKERLESLGVTVVLTRESDLLPDDGGEGSRKSKDLRQRVRVVADTPNAILVSVHMNRFPESAVKGMTFYYSPNHPDSYRLAKLMHERLLATLQSENKRPMKEASGNIYLLYHTAAPAVLVECGFLSNPEEEALLGTEVYQDKIAALFAESILAYINEKESP